jgi:hypothetical protein
MTTIKGTLHVDEAVTFNKSLVVTEEMSSSTCVKAPKSKLTQIQAYNGTSAMIIENEQSTGNVSFKNDLIFSNFRIKDMKTTTTHANQKTAIATFTEGANSDAWEKGKTYQSIKANNDTKGATFKITTDASTGKPTFTLTAEGQAHGVSAGAGYAVADVLTFTDPGNTSFTATITVASLKQATFKHLLICQAANAAPDGTYYGEENDTGCTVTTDGTSWTHGANVINRWTYP